MCVLPFDVSDDDVTKGDINTILRSLQASKRGSLFSDIISFAKAGRSLLHGSIVSSSLRLCWLSHSIAHKAFRLLHLQCSSAQIFCLARELLQHSIRKVLPRAILSCSGGVCDHWWVFVFLLHNFTTINQLQKIEGLRLCLVAYPMLNMLR